MVMGLTGAWFTHHDSKVAQDSAGTITFRDDAMSLTFSEVGNSEILRKNGSGEYVKYADLDDGTDDLMPGDKITFADVLITFAVDSTNTAYYVIKYDNKYWSSQGVEITAASGLLTCANGDTVLFESVADIVIPGEGTLNTAQGTEYTTGVAVFGAFEVRMMQTENITQEAAYAYLVTNWPSPAPANKA